jgi:acyl-CoA hydrolase
MIMHQERWVQGWHMNSKNILFGGQLLSWVDEDTTMLAYNCVRTEDGGKFDLVTAGMNHVQFLKEVPLGDRLIFSYKLVHVGRKSLTIAARVMSYEHDKKSNHDSDVFKALVTLCLVQRLEGKTITRSIMWGDKWGENLLAECVTHRDGLEQLKKDEMWAFVEKMLNARSEGFPRGF